MASTDNEPLTTKIKDMLANTLGNDWKRFAIKTGYVNDSDINNIDIDIHVVYEKCYEMLTIWGRKSPTPVTIALVKSLLGEIGRNDILLDIFHVDPPCPEPAALRGNLAGTVCNNSLSEPTVYQLKDNHIKKLQDLLDPDNGAGMNNWKALGDDIFQGDRDVKDSIGSFHLHYSGGGSPAKAFLKGLGMRHPSFSVGEFIDLAMRLGRNDIATFLEDLECPAIQFRQLDDRYKDTVAGHLDMHLYGSSNYRSFADALGYTVDEIDSFKLALKEPDQYSPTKALIDLIKRKYSSMKLSQIKTAAINIGRGDVALYLDKVIKEITGQKNN